MWLTSSSIGRKFVMALTGAFLILFVTFHALMNGVALFWPTAYNVVCEFLGANWYALIGTAILALGFILHIWFATVLTIQNRKARGSERYAVNARPPQVEWSSKNMYILGIVILAFLVVHLINFWAKMQFVEMFKIPVNETIGGYTAVPAAGTLFLQQTFGGGAGWIFFAVYAVGFIALWFHLTHGFWSMFQSCGWNGDTWMPRLKAIGNVWVTLVVALFMAEALVFTINAQQEKYIKCDNEVKCEQFQKLDAQYREMEAAYDLEHCEGVCCEKPQPCCDKACDGKGCEKACPDCPANCNEPVQSAKMTADDAAKATANDASVVVEEETKTVTE